MAKKTVKHQQHSKKNKPRKAQITEAPKERPPLPTVFELSRLSISTIATGKRLFGGIVAIYGLLYVLFVQGINGGLDVASLRDASVNKIVGGVNAYGQLLGGSGTNETAGVYQTVLFLLASLAFIWAMRQIVSNNTVRIRDAYYKGMYPLIPFILVLIFVGLQLLPFIVAGSVYQAVLDNNIAITVLEKLVWAVPAIALSFVSLYFIASSLFAVYIVTLPDMTPLVALRSAKKLVHERRWLVLRKLLFLPVILLVGIGIITLPIIIVIPVIAQWVLLILGLFAFVFAHVYIYTLYRGLIGE